MTEQLTLFTPAIAPKTYEGQRVVTLRDIDEIHRRPVGTARRNFKQNQEHFIEGVDYFVRNSYEARCEYGIEAPNGLKLLTLTGYLMIVKSFTDDLSWAIQRELVTGYFAGRRQGKTFMGTPVITLADYCRETGEKYSTAKSRLRKRYEAGEMPLGSALLLEGRNLRLFMQENPEQSAATGHIYILTREGAQRLMSTAKGEVARKPKQLTE